MIPYNTTGQPSVTCQECHTELGSGTRKDVVSHLLVCLKVAPNTLENMRRNAEHEHSEHGSRVLHILDALQAEVT